MESRHKIDNLSEYLKVISEADKISDKSPLWFRGDSSDKFDLLPGIYRSYNAHLKSDETTLINEFFQYSHNFLERDGHDGWDWLAMMQHYGMPTRLLDWSESSLVALYFALKGNEASKELPTIWVTSPYDLNEKSIGDNFIQLAASPRLFSWLPENLRIEGATRLHKGKEKPIKNKGKYPIAVYVRYTNPRITAQSGAFTLHGEYDRCLKRYFDTKSIKYRKFVLEPKNGQKMEKLKRGLLWELENVGVHELSLFPELSSVAKFITSRRS